MIPKFNPEERKFIRKWLTAGTIIIVFFIVLMNFHAVFLWLKGLYKVFEPFLFGFFVAFLLKDAIYWVESVFFSNFKMRRLWATLSVFVLLMAAMTAAVWISLPKLFESSMALATQLPVVLETIQTALTGSNLPKQLIHTIQDLLNNFGTFLSDTLSLQIPVLIDQAFSFTGGLFTFFMSLIVALYFLLDMEFYQRSFKKLTLALFDPKDAERILALSRLSGPVYRDFMYSRLASSGLLFVMMLLVLGIFRIDHALLFAIILAIANLIPILGIWMVWIPLVIYLFFVNLSGFWTLLAVTLLYLIIDNFSVQPMVQKDSFHLKTFWVILVIVVIGHYFGLLGILLALPLFSIMYRKGSGYFNLESMGDDDV